MIPVKEKLFSLLGSLLIVIAACSQTSRVNVLVTNGKSEPFPGATAVLYQLPDSSIAGKAVVTKDTYFEVNQFAEYYLLVTAAGMQPEGRKISLKDTSITVTIKLNDKVGNLSAVTVVSKKPLITQEDDKTVVDATALTISSTNAYEVLEKTPGAIVDQDGNVYLSSTSPATVFINGREMKLSSADLASLLKSLPANSVSKIEILRNPSAKFDAASSGGIINIVLKKGVKLGTSGSVNLAYFQGVYGTKTGGFNINKSAGKINSYFSYQYTNRNNFEKLNSARKINTDSTLIAQQSYTTYPAATHYIGTGLDINLSDKWTTGYDLRLTTTANNSNAVSSVDISDYETLLQRGRNESHISNDNRSTFIGNTFSAKYKVDSLGSEWTSSMEYNYYKYKNEQNYINYTLLPVKPAISGDGKTSNQKNIFVFQSDLTLKLPYQYTLEAGVKFSTSNSNNSALYFIDTGNNVRLPDNFQTNTFRYKETIGAAYLQVSKTFFGFTLKPGLRLETTDINGRQLIPKDTVFSIRRADVFPYVFIKHKLFKMFGFPLVGNAIYRRSIKRPYYESLNPYPKYIDQYLFEAGNPDLRPQFTTNYEFNVTFDNFPVLAVGINDTKDIFSNVTYQDNVTKIALRTFDNLGKNKEFYCKVIGGIPPGGKYFFYVGAQYNYNQYRGVYQDQPLNYNRGSYVFFMFHELKATKTFTVNMQGFMRTKGLQNLYELNTFGGLFVSFNKSILQKKANVILSVNDLLQTNRVSFNLNQADVNASGKRINDTRRLGLTFRYNFGIKPREEKKAAFDAPAESKD